MNKAFVQRLLSENTPIVGYDQDGMLYLGTQYLCMRFPAGTELPEGIELSHQDMIVPYYNVFERLIQKDTRKLVVPSIADIDEYTKGYHRGDPVRYDFLALNPKMEDAPVVNALYLRNIFDLYSKKDALYGCISSINEPLLFWNGVEYAQQTQAVLFQIRRKS